MEEQDNQHQLDLLLHIERLTEDLNRKMGGHSATAIKRYPITFALLTLFGAALVNEGIKGILKSIGWLENPYEQLIAGLIILIILGSVYIKLGKKE